MVTMDMLEQDNYSDTDIILLTQCYYHQGIRLNAMKRFCIFSY